MLQIRRDESSNNTDDYKLFINGIPDKEILVVTHRPHSAEIFWHIEIRDYDVFRRLNPHTFLDLPDRIDYMLVGFKPDWSDLIEHICISPPYPEHPVNQSYFFIEVSFKPELPLWNKPYNFNEYMDEFERIYKASPIPNTEMKQSRDHEDYGFWLRLAVVESQTGIVREVERFTAAIHDYCMMVGRALGERLSNKIEIKKKENPKRDTDYQLFINGALISEANVYGVYDSPSHEPYAEITIRDKDTSRLIASNRLSDFPVIAKLWLRYYLDDLKYLDNRDEIYIEQDYEKGFTGKFSLALAFGGSALAEWRESYSFKDYAWEMFKAFKAMDNLIDVDLSDTNRSLSKEHMTDRDEPYWLDKSLDKIDKNRIQSLTLEFPYSAQAIIADEITRITKIIRPVHDEVVRSLTSGISDSRIEVRRNEAGSKPEHQLFINGILMEKAFVDSGFGTEGEYFSISTLDYETTETIIQYSLAEMPPLDHMSLRYRVNWSELVDAILIHPTTKRRFYEILFVLKPNLAAWDKPYTFEEYCDELSRLLKIMRNPELDFNQYREDQSYVTALEIGFPLSSLQVPLAYEVNKHSEILRILHEDIERVFASRLRSSSVIMYFDFPQEIKVTCEQYLLYFVQFLKDLGVEAKSELKDEVGQVLFAVTPNDPQQALNKIRTALEIYLQLPASPVSDQVHSEIEIQMLVSTIHRLKSDLALSHAMLQAKTATIEAQQLTIDIHKSLLSGDIVINSLKDITPKPEDKEDVLGGVLALATYKDKGVEINLAELYRKLKRFFKDSE